MSNWYETDIKVSDLTVDHRVQRVNLDTGKVNKIIANYNADAIGRLTLSERDNGEIIIIDGWHRWEAVRRITSNEGFVPVKVFKGLTLQEEAALFLALNNTNSPKLMDRFLVRVVKGDVHAEEMMNLAKARGWFIDSVAGDHHINAVGAVERIHWLSKSIDADPPLIDLVLLAVTRAWGHNRYGVQAGVFDGLGRLLAEHGSKVDMDRLINVLKDWELGPEGLLTQARHHASVQRMRLPFAVADLVTSEYNKGLRTKGLPQWRRRH